MDVVENLKDMLTCPVCQDIFQDPRQLACGHSFCLSCLEKLSDHSETALLRCPNCRQDFRPPVEISKSYTLSSIAEEYWKLRRRNVGLLESNTWRQMKQIVSRLLSVANSIIKFLFYLLLVIVVFACLVEHQALMKAQRDQQNRIDHIDATITEHLVDRPLNSQRPPEIKDEEVLMLDLDTANDHIEISSDLRTAKKVGNRMGYPSVPTRFHGEPQVLSAHCYHTGTHGWEVEAEGFWDIAVSFRSIKHESKFKTAFGNNRRSWSLTHDDNGDLEAYHDGEKTVLSATLESNRVAVMVDIEKGIITFASMGSAVTRLHEFQANLTEPVCLGLGLHQTDPPSIASILKAW